MGFAIDEAKRLVLTQGHQAIIRPRDLDFKDFPTTDTLLTTHTYNHWQVTPTNSSVYCQLIDNAYIHLHASYSNHNSGGVTLLSRRNVRGAIIHLSYSWNGDADATGSVTVRSQLVTSTGTVLVSMYDYTYMGNNPIAYAFTDYIWWSGNTCHISHSSGVRISDYTTEITSSDVRIRLFFEAAAPTSTDYAVMEGNVFNVSVY